MSILDEMDIYEEYDEKMNNIDSILRKQRINNYIENERIARKNLFKATGAAVILGLTVGGTLGVMVKNKYDSDKKNKKERQIISSEVKDEYDSLDSVVNGAIHLTSDRKALWVDYSSIGLFINEQEDKDLYIYALLTSYGSRHMPVYNGITSKSLCYVQDDNGVCYKDLDDYFSRKGVKDKEQYIKEMEKKILIEYQINQLVDDLSNNEIESNSSSKTK